MALTSILEYDEKDKASDRYVTKLPATPMSADVKDKVINYLINDDFKGFASAELPFPDPWNGNLLWNFGRTYSDGRYSWNDKLPFYVRDHDLSLPASFIEHVMDFYGNGGAVSPSYDWRTERLSPRPTGRTH